MQIVFFATPCLYNPSDFATLSHLLLHRGGLGSAELQPTTFTWGRLWWVQSCDYLRRRLGGVKKSDLGMRSLFQKILKPHLTYIFS